MRSLKRIFALIMAVCMLSGIVVAMPVSAESEKYVLVKYDNEETVAASASQWLTSGGLEETYNGVTSLKFTSKGNTDYIKFPEPTEKNWTKYKWLHIRMYAQRAGMEFNIIPTTFNDTNVTHNPYFLKEYTTIAPGWQVVSVPIETSSAGFGDYAKKLSADATESTAPSWSNIGGLCMITGEWDAAKLNSGDVIYFDEIWLGDYEITSNSTGVDGTVLLDTTSIEAIEGTLSGAAVPCTTQAREDGNSAYALLTIPAKTEKTWTIKNFDTPIDLTASGAKKYLNMWIYSPRAYNGGLQLMCYDTNGGFGMFVGTTAVNWQGWKLVTIDLSATPKAKSGSKGFTKSSVSGIGINVYGWSSNNYVGHWHESAQIGFEKVWLSSTKPTAPTVAVPTTAERTQLPAENLLLVDFNSSDVADALTKQGDSWKMTGDNPRVYDINARMGWAEQYGYRPVLYYDSTAAVSSSAYKYWNTWVYNPGVKLNNGKAPELLFAINHPDSTSACTAKVNLDWTGWKLISVNIEEMMGTDYGKGLQKLRILANNSGSVVKVPDNGNFLDVERSWLSAEAPVTSFGRAENGSSIALNATDVPVNIGSYSLTMKSEPDARLLDRVTVYKGTEALSADKDYTISVNGKRIDIAFIGDLDYTTKYTVRLDKSFADVFGNMLGTSRAYSFTTKAYEKCEIGDFVFGEDNKSVSVTVKVNEAEKEYPFMLILAEMNGNVLERVDVATPAYTSADGEQTITASLDNRTDGTELRAFLWNDKLEPYMADEAR